MKELSIEEKAKAYDEALERAIAWRKKYVNFTISEDGTMIQDFDNIFPELAESEDEKTIKEIKQFIRSRGMSLAQSKVDSWLAWLEKQGEQKPAWSEEDEDIFDGIIEDIEVLKEEERNKDVKAAYQREIDWLKSLKYRILPKQEWSEEDEKMLDEIYKFFDTQKVPFLKHDMNDYAKFIKSLRPQSTWNPSIAQLNALSIVSKGNAPDDIEAIVSLYQDLLKLKG